MRPLTACCPATTYEDVGSLTWAGIQQLSRLLLHSTSSLFGALHHWVGEAQSSSSQSKGGRQPWGRECHLSMLVFSGVPNPAWSLLGSKQRFVVPSPGYPWVECPLPALWSLGYCQITLCRWSLPQGETHWQSLSSGSCHLLGSSIAWNVRAPDLEPSFWDSRPILPLSDCVT